MTYPLYLTFGFLPSVIWLLFYLRKDAHPESNRMVLIIFFYGMLAAIPAALIELGVFKITTFLSSFNLSLVLISVLNFFIGIALVEEILKYLVVKGKVLNNPEFDEPLDVMLYMIIAALGFAALENVLILFSPEVFLKPVEIALSITAFRFIGATFLHTLCSGLIGYFLALSFFETKSRAKLLAFGLTIAIILHGLYNFSIMGIEGYLKFLIPIIILVALAIFVSLGFRKLKKMRSVCKISL